MTYFIWNCQQALVLMTAKAKNILNRKIRVRWIKKIGKHEFLAIYLLFLYGEDNSRQMKVINGWKMRHSKYIDNNVEKSYLVLTFKRDYLFPQTVWMYLLLNLYPKEINIFANTSTYLFCTLSHMFLRKKKKPNASFIPHIIRHRIVKRKKKKSIVRRKKKKHKLVPANNAHFSSLPII